MEFLTQVNLIKKVILNDLSITIVQTVRCITQYSSVIIEIKKKKDKD
jgi:hypothetical protein